MKMRYHLALSLVLFLTSCNGVDNFDIDLDSKYTITKGDILFDAVVFVHGQKFNASAVTPINPTDIEYFYDDLPLYFQSDCPLSRDEIGSFSKEYGYSDELSKDYLRCTGTEYCTYSTRKKGTAFSFNIQDGIHGVCAIVSVADLQTYTLTSKEDQTISFNLYGAISTPYLTVKVY